MAEKEEIDITKLSLEEKCNHKNWKARVSGYEDMMKIFRKIDDPKSPEWVKYANLVRKFPTDSHAAAQEKGLEVTLMFMDNAAVAIKIVPEVLDGIISKCITAAKTRSKELVVDIALMCVEIEKYEAVQEGLMKGMDHKNPKVVAGCLAILYQNLNLFGPKCITMKSLLKKILPLSEDRDKIVREEVKKLIVELYRWIGNSLRSQLTSVKSTVLQELELEFQKIGDIKPAQTRFFRSQQAKRETVASGCVDDEMNYQSIVENISVEIDPLESLVPVNILSKLPKDFYEKLDAPKWQDRKEILGTLETLITSNPKLEAGDYSDLVRKLKLLITKDSNVLVVTLAGKCICGLANGLQKKFTPYAASCISSLFVKFKEKKAVVVASLRDASDACFAATNLENIQEDAIQALQNKNPAVKLETLLFLARAFLKTTVKVMLDKKLMKPYFTAIVTNINEPDPSVRDAAAEALGVALKLAGEKAMSAFLNDLEPMKLQKVKQFAETAVVAKTQTMVASKVPLVKAVNNIPVVKSKCVTADSLSNGVSVSPKKGNDCSVRGHTAVRTWNQDKFVDEAEICGEDAPDNTLRVSIRGKITSDILTALTDKNWKVKDEALDKLSKIIAEAKFIESDLGELPKILAQRLQDSNRIVFTNAFLFSQNLATALGRNCKQHITALLPNMLAGLSDSKAGVRVTVTACINCWANNAGVNEFFQGEMIADALKNGNPFLRSELLDWLSIKLSELKNINKEELKNCVPVLLVGIEDRNPVVRKSCYEAILPFMTHLGYDTLSRAAGNLKPGSKLAVQAVLDKARSDMAIKAPTMSNKMNSVIKKNAPSSTTTTTRVDLNKNMCVDAEEVVHNVAEESKRNMGKVAVKNRTSVNSKKDASDNEETVKSSIPVNRLKVQRNTDETKQKILRWNFITPRGEFTDLLKELMGNAGLGKILMVNMFHTDFKCHLKALETLAEELSHGIDGTVSNLDLILKWLSIRFYDTNPTVLIKSLDYLLHVFQSLGKNGYKMTDIEASSFIPHLVQKIGEPKDTVRSNVHQIIRQICCVYSSTKVFGFVLDGLKSKNARQRCECLDEMSHMISNHGITGCTPNQGGTLKEIARQISDRDNNVRNSALNAVVETYFISGDKIFKLIGHLSDKDRSLLEERIKRAKKSRPLVRPQTSIKKTVDRQLTENVATTTTAISASLSKSLEENPTVLPSSYTCVHSSDIEQLLNTTVTIDPEDVQDICHPIVNEAPVAVSGLLNKYQLDYESVDDMFRDEVDYPVVLDFKLRDTNIDYLNSEEPITLPPRRTQTKEVIQPGKIELRENKIPSSVSHSIDLVITQLGYSNLLLATQSVVQLEAIITDPEVVHLIESKLDNILAPIAIQLGRTLPVIGCVSSDQTEKLNKFIRSCVILLTSVYQKKRLPKFAGKETTKDILFQILGFINCPNINSLPDATMIVKQMNILVIRVIEDSEPNVMVSVVLGLLNETNLQNLNVRLAELIMKCSWKFLKQMGVWAAEKKRIDWNFQDIANEFNSFLKVHPKNSFSHKDVSPLKTAKSIIHSIVMQLGPVKVQLVVENMPELRGTEAYVYLNKLISRETANRLKFHKENADQPSKLTVDSLNAVVTSSSSNMGHSSKECFNPLPDPSTASSAKSKVAVYLQRLKMIEQQRGIHATESDSAEFSTTES